jgi:isocitrate dehydrogenase (NAD+)
MTSNVDPSWSHSLDHIANNIASATFQVLNAGRVKTADMGGELSVDSSSPNSLYSRLGSATTHEFTAAVIKNLE